MKKQILMIMVVCLSAVSICGLVWAAAFNVALTVPYSTGLIYTISEITYNTVTKEDEWKDASSLDFGELVYDPEFKIFRPAKYFAIDVNVAVGGAGSPNNITLSYVDLRNPNNDVKNGRGGLGKKGTITTVKAVDGEDDVPVKTMTLLSQASTVGPLSKTQFSGGWPRFYVGIYDGKDSSLNAAGWEVFTAQDAPGSYTGLMTISAVVN